MKKIIAGFCLLACSMTCFSGENYCGDIQRTRVWANGSDMYGIWIEYKNNPSQCSGGFYISKDATYKDLVYSTILAAKMASQQICIQVLNHESDLENRCRLHYVYHP